MIGMSRSLAVVEAVALALPVSLLFLLAVPNVLLGATGYSGIVAIVPTVASAAMAGALVSSWSLLVLFIRGGREALSSETPYHWVMMGLGLVVAAAGVASVLLPTTHRFVTPTEDIWMKVGAFSPAAVLAIPYCHLCLERYLAWRSNYRLERP